MKGVARPRRKDRDPVSESTWHLFRGHLFRGRTSQHRRDAIEVHYESISPQKWVAPCISGTLYTNQKRYHRSRGDAACSYRCGWHLLQHLFQLLAYS